MNMKKILAAATASVLTVSAMSVVASAAVTNPNGDEFGQPGKYVFTAGADLGDDLANCTKVVVNITVDDAAFAEGGCGGGIATNNEPFAWVEFGNDGSNKDIITDGKTIEFDSLSFEAGADAQVVIEGWWGSDFSVDSITYFTNDGTALKTVEVGNDAPVESTPEESTPAESTPAESAPESTPAESAPESTPAESAPESTPAESDTDGKGDSAESDAKAPVATGVGGVAAIFGVVAVAAGALVVAKKRK